MGCIYILFRSKFQWLHENATDVLSFYTVLNALNAYYVSLNCPCCLMISAFKQPAGGVVVNYMDPCGTRVEQQVDMDIIQLAFQATQVLR